MSFIQNTVKSLFGEHKAICTKKDMVRRFISKSPSFPDQFSIMDFNEKEDLFLLDDGISVGSGLEISDLQTEAMPDESLEAVYKKITDTFSNVVPCHRVSPWVMQIFINDEYVTEPFKRHIRKNLSSELISSPFTKQYLKHMDRLFDNMARADGLLFDPKTDMPYRVRIRRIRVLFYRRYADAHAVSREEAVKEHLKVIKQVKNKFKATNIDARRMKGNHFYEWFVKWFNPNPGQTKGSTEALLKRYPYPKNKVSAFNFIQNSLFSPPESNKRGFEFDGMKQRVVFLNGLRDKPEIGILSRERKQVNEKHRYGLLDCLPEGSTYTVQVVFEHEDKLDGHLKKIESNIIGGGSEGKLAKANIISAKDEIFKGNRLYWVTQAIYFQAKTQSELEDIEESLHEIFSVQANLPLIPSEFDLHPIDSYLSMMPFNYMPELARKNLGFDNLMYASELAALLPIYGRFKGDRNMSSLIFFNRLGEMVSIDILDKRFISFNSHMALFANSGGGKSVLISHFTFSMIATKNARVVLFEMGNSFDGLVEHCSAMGKKTKQLMFSNDSKKAVAINPFCDAFDALEQVKDCIDIEQVEKVSKEVEEVEKGLGNIASDEEKTCDKNDRNYLGELTLVLKTMITQANENEEKKFTLADESLLIEVLCDAILKTTKDGHQQMLTEHVVEAFNRRLESEPNLTKKARVSEFVDRLKNYLLNPGLRRQFNVPSESMEDFDVMHVDIGAIKDEPGKIALIMLSLLPKIISLAERTQFTKRPTFLVIDEAHLQFQVGSIVSYALLIAKVARKLGLWLVPATQSIKDLNSVKAKKILSLCESWIVLGLDESEISNINEFKSLTDEQTSLIRDIDSHKGLYAEAVFLGSRVQGLFRVLPPRYLLALSMTEKDEKSERDALEKKYGRLQAAEIMAKTLEDASQKQGGCDDDAFLD